MFCYWPNDIKPKYKISIDVKDDLSAMKEVIYRRYYRVLLDGLKKPDLIIVDGGELQVNATKEILTDISLRKSDYLDIDEKEYEKYYIITGEERKEILEKERINVKKRRK